MLWWVETGAGTGKYPLLGGWHQLCGFSKWPHYHCFPHHPERLVLVLPVATMSICLSLLCPFGSTVVQTQGILWVTKKKKKSFLFWLPGVRVWWVDFFYHLIFHHCTLQLLLVCIRIAEFVCTLINILLKCFDVLISWFLGNPSTKEASWVEGCWLFIVLFLLVGIDPRLPAQGQCALSSINPCGLKDLKREGKKLRRVHDCSLWTQTNFPVSFLLSLSQQHLMRGKVVKRLVQLGGRRDVKVKVAGWEVLGSIHFRAKVHFWPIVFSIERLNFPEMFCKFRWTRPDSAPSF